MRHAPHTVRTCLVDTFQYHFKSTCTRVVTFFLAQVIMILLGIASLVVAGAVAIWLSTRRAVRAFGATPGPPCHWLLGNSRELVPFSQIHDLLHALHVKYGGRSAHHYVCQPTA